MPLLPGKKNIGYNIQELHKGPRYAANLKKFGKAKADQIAVAAAESAATRRARRRKVSTGRGGSRTVSV